MLKYRQVYLRAPCIVLLDVPTLDMIQNVPICKLQFAVQNYKCNVRIEHVRSKWKQKV